MTFKGSRIADFFKYLRKLEIKRIDEMSDVIDGKDVDKYLELAKIDTLFSSAEAFIMSALRGYGEAIEAKNYYKAKHSEAQDKIRLQATEIDELVKRISNINNKNHFKNS